MIGGRWRAAIWLAVLWSGCQAPPPATAPGEVSLRVVDEREYAVALAAERGKVVLVDFWATWCAPCVQIFPHNVALHRQFGPHGFTVISVSLDEPRDQAQVLDFLRSQQATFPNYLSRYGAGTRTIEGFEAGEGALPYLKLYDRQGVLRKTFGLGAEPVDPQLIQRSVAEMIADR